MCNCFVVNRAGKGRNSPPAPSCLSHLKEMFNIWSMTLDYLCHFFGRLCWASLRVMKSFRPLERVVTVFNPDAFSTNYHHFRLVQQHQKAQWAVEMLVLSFCTDRVNFMIRNILETRKESPRTNAHPLPAGVQVRSLALHSPWVAFKVASPQQ